MEQNQTAEILSFMKNPAHYPEPTTKVEMIETHISWVFLTDRYAYKMKKPVTFDFLDFSELAFRKDACEVEVRLNTRFSAGVYLGVVALVQEGNRLCLLDQDSKAQNGRLIIEYLVKMRRLPEPLFLDHLIQTNELDDDQVRRLSSHLGQLYAMMPPAEVAVKTFLELLYHHVADNETTLIGLADVLGVPEERIRQIHQGQREFMVRHQTLFQDRIERCKIIEGHGDLRPEHVVMVEPPVLFDCIEFNRDYRIVDVIDELAFLAVECELLGRGDLGLCVRKSYEKCSGDQVNPRLWDFYESYRAMVRAKVTGLRLTQSGVERERLESLARWYIDKAAASVAQLTRPYVLIVGGGMGSGKSRLAQTLARHYGAKLLRSDEVRRELFAQGSEPVAFDAGPYTAANRELVYAAMQEQAGRALAIGKSLVLDATFATEEQRSRVYELALSYDADFLAIFCQCPPDVAKRRIVTRLKQGDDASAARPELVGDWLAKFEPPSHRYPWIETATDRDFELEFDQVTRTLSSDFTQTTTTFAAN